MDNHLTKKCTSPNAITFCIVVMGIVIITQLIVIVALIGYILFRLPTQTQSYVQPVPTSTQQIQQSNLPPIVPPKPISSQPASPQPALPQPVSLQPVSLQPASPQPASPQPASPQPVLPQPVLPQPVSPSLTNIAQPATPPLPIPPTQNLPQPKQSTVVVQEKEVKQAPLISPQKISQQLQQHIKQQQLIEAAEVVCGYKATQPSWELSAFLQQTDSPAHGCQQACKDFLNNQNEYGGYVKNALSLPLANMPDAQQQHWNQQFKTYNQGICQLSLPAQTAIDDLTLRGGSPFAGQTPGLNLLQFCTELHTLQRLCQHSTDSI